MKTFLRGLLFGFVGSVVAFACAIVEGIGGAFGAATGNISPSPYLVWGVAPVVATACLSRFIGRKEAGIAATIVLGLVLWRCRMGYAGYLKEGGVWAKAAPHWLSLMLPIATLSVALNGAAITWMPKRNEKNA